MLPFVKNLTIALLISKINYHNLGRKRTLVSIGTHDYDAT